MTSATGVCLAAIWPIYPVLCACAVLTGAGLCAVSVVVRRHIGHTGASLDFVASS